MNSPVSLLKLTVSVVKNPPTEKILGIDGSNGEYQTFKEEIIPILNKLTDN